MPTVLYILRYDDHQYSTVQYVLYCTLLYRYFNTVVQYTVLYRAEADAECKKMSSLKVRQKNPPQNIIHIIHIIHTKESNKTRTSSL